MNRRHFLALALWAALVAALQASPAARAGDAVVRDPNRPSDIQAAYDSGDHLHPNDTGYKAMAEAIDLKLLMGPR